MAAFSHPASFVLDPFFEPDRFSTIITTTGPCFSPIFPREHVQEISLHADQFHEATTHVVDNIEVPSIFITESPVNATQKLSSPSWAVNDIERATDRLYQDALLINPVQPNRKHQDFKEEKESKGEKRCTQNCDFGKPERKRPEPRARKEKKVAKEHPLTGYVHVRARRGEATDPHSLAERVRRKKISVRMKLLQSLVPGCDKLTGKAQILDEIIRHVLSLQNQVEFLAAKFTSENGIANEVNYEMNTLVAKELYNSELQESSSAQLISFMEATSASMLRHHHQEATNATTQAFDYDF
ncbi:transcription factor bHLH62 [Ricinus communis]|uniref:BHLH domain-containing protein n=1 Tax=Ricinus communis TaxID=3988 RepID=B9RFY0_RICCO|nr:transcription factor bHLH62 [Ricinus communis]EEF50101.1 conserved hypothetical protein [Ricinus communis]|eukprot:XP_002512649.1 transcription factor bHLH62 [Ricinus communis]